MDLGYKSAFIIVGVLTENVKLFLQNKQPLLILNKMMMIQTCYALCLIYGFIPCGILYLARFCHVTLLSSCEFAFFVMQVQFYQPLDYKFCKHRDVNYKHVISI